MLLFWCEGCLFADIGACVFVLCYSVCPLLCPGCEVVLYFYFIKHYSGLFCTNNIVHNCNRLKICYTYLDTDVDVTAGIIASKHSILMCI